MFSTDFYCDFHGPIVESDAGKMRGYFEKGLFKFKGIPYASAKRFQSPQPVPHWEGVLDCLCYGNTCPVMENTTRYHIMPMLEFRYWPQDENCLNLNVFTTDINNDVRKPVMVFIHGGRFTNGSCIEHLTYEPENLVKDEDVVLVSINHRLNILGYFDLSPYGSRYKNSANLGQEDIISALQWIQRNISKFGGDPDNVTIFGQSGGGMKCTSLMQTPSTEGLFHKVIIESGAMKDNPFTESPDKSPIARAVLKKLGISEANIEDIEDQEKYPYSRLCEAFKSVEPELIESGINTQWGPTANDWYVGDPVIKGPTDLFKKTPVIIGSTIAEALWFRDEYYDPDMSEDEKIRILNKKYGSETNRLISIFKNAYPDKDFFDLYYYDTVFRKGTIDYLDLRSKDGYAPTYSYMISYTFKIDGGMPAWHASDHPLVFKSYDMCPVMQDENIPKLSDQIAGAWAAFAHTGNPNHSDIDIEWKPYKKGNGEYTILFDKKTTLRDGYDRELVNEVDKVFTNTLGLAGA